MRFFTLLLLMSCTRMLLAHELPICIDHSMLPSYMNQGNTLIGLATPSLGASDCEVWRSSIAPGSCTPLHQHDVQEIFIFLSGEGKALVGSEEITFKAPCTLILPANIPHQIFNTGHEPSAQIVILKSKTAIYTATGAPMNLPWRR